MKSPEMIRIIFELTRIDTNQAITEKICPFCHEPVGEFRDSVSEKEFNISGLCQSCQDGVFGSDENDGELLDPFEDENNEQGVDNYPNELKY